MWDVDKEVREENTTKEGTERKKKQQEGEREKTRDRKLYEISNLDRRFQNFPYGFFRTNHRPVNASRQHISALCTSQKEEDRGQAVLHSLELSREDEAAKATVPFTSTGLITGFTSGFDLRCI